MALMLSTDRSNIVICSFFACILPMLCYIWVKPTDMRYECKLLSAQKHLIEVTFSFKSITNNTIVQIPYWRPGRYEAGNFARNYIGFSASANGRPLAFRKINTHQWMVLSAEGEEVTLSYTLFAAELTAGNTYYDEDVLLINPVNALVYLPGREMESIELRLVLPELWKCATALKPAATYTQGELHHYTASGVQELMDSPLLASQHLKSNSYESFGIEFHFHLCGWLPYNLEGILADFHAFTEMQIDSFGSFPVDEYHFLLLFLPKRARHGVEHENSTVIILGPADQMDHKEMYNSLLRIASHELYHTWNVKYLRPREWTPYDFTQASPSRLGYVAEGVTTYMGDWMLWQAGVFTDEEFLQELSNLWQQHLDNPGRHRLSLADASIDTWTDGYGGGAPGRRVSIYTEGALLAFVCDAWITDSSQGCYGLYSAMRKLYETCDPEVGYTEDQYWQQLEHLADKPWNELRAAVVDGRGALEGYVKEALRTLGLEVNTELAQEGAIAWWGVRMVSQEGKIIVASVAEDSPSEAAGLWVGNVVKSINDLEPSQFIADSNQKNLLLQPAKLVVSDGYKTRTLYILPDGKSHARRYTISISNHGDSESYLNWKKALTQIT